MLDECRPVRRILLAYSEAEVAQHLGGAPLADPHVDGALIQPRLRGGQPGHRGQEGDAYFARRVGYGHAVGCLPLGPAQRPAVEGLLVRVVELQAAGPGLVRGHALDDEIDADVAGRLPAVLTPHVAHVHAAPQEIRVRNRNRDQVAAVDGDAGSLLRRALAGALLVPAFQADVPEGERLHRRRLSGVVRADEDHRIPELDFDLLEALEVADRQLRQHSMNQRSNRSSAPCASPIRSRQSRSTRSSARDVHSSSGCCRHILNASVATMSASA